MMRTTLIPGADVKNSLTVESGRQAGQTFTQKMLQ